jgi:hypothetical protein
MERTNSFGSETCSLVCTSDEYKFPNIARQLSLRCVWNILQPRNVQTYTEGNKLVCRVANKQKEGRGLSAIQICICTVQYSLTARNKKIVCDNHTHDLVT